MKQRNGMIATFAAAAIAALGASVQMGRQLAAAPGGTAHAADVRIQFPRIWSAYQKVESLDADFADLRAHGVEGVGAPAGNLEEAKAALAAARRHGMQYYIALRDVTEMGTELRDRGFRVEPALMIGGAYQGKAIDRHVFRFTAGKHTILIEPPVYNKRFPYTLGSRATGDQAPGEPIGHYYPDMPDPLRAEIVVPLKRFDGRQHLKVITARVEPAQPGDVLEVDSVTPDLPDSSETRNRRLYRVSFDLTGLESALLDRVGIAVYWPYQGTKRYWIFGRGNIAAASAETRRALRQYVRDEIAMWATANGGGFPSDVIRFARAGDECFYITGGTAMDAPAVSYPLWDYSQAAIEAFRREAGQVQYPRTWGYPEIYGTAAYAHWLYSFHKSTAELLGIVREELKERAPGVLVFRNMTRFGVFHPANDFDGSGPELMTANSDVVHLDPYPVSARGYEPAIPRDMSYYAGLARRYGEPLLPWMQAHTYGGAQGLQHVTPDQIERMMREQRAQGVDAIMWLGYGPGQTFPRVRPESWEAAARLHRAFEADPPRKPHAELAVLRGYEARSLASFGDGVVRNPADWLLQQWLEVWAVQHGQPYDVFEVPPGLTGAGRRKLNRKLKRYRFVAGTTPYGTAWRIGAGTESQELDARGAAGIQRGFEREMKRRGWLR